MENINTIGEGPDQGRTSDGTHGGTVREDGTERCSTFASCCTVGDKTAAGEQQGCFINGNLVAFNQEDQQRKVNFSEH